jgi:hypothetical protein
MADYSSESTERSARWPAPMSWEAPMRLRFFVVLAALVLPGCNANPEANLSSRAAAGVLAGPDYNPYNPISYAQNNTGNRSGGR